MGWRTDELIAAVKRADAARSWLVRQARPALDQASRHERWAAAGAAFLALASVAGLVVKAPASPATPRPVPIIAAAPAAPSPVHPPAPSVPPPAPAVPRAPNDLPAPASGVAFAGKPIAVRSGPSYQSLVSSRIGAGVPLPVVASQGAFLRVRTPCDIGGWIPAAEVRLERGRAAIPLRNAASFAGSTFVVDAGHGGSAQGAVGPSGLEEKVVNLDIVGRLRELLSKPRDVDPATGAISEGDTYGVPRTILTRTGDWAASLEYRALIANGMAADAFMSVHNNAEPDGRSPGPGTETFYQIRSAPSKRLAGLALEEIRRALDVFKGVPWAASTYAGAKYRLNERGTDYYGVLRRSAVPAVIVEGAFISNAPEEALLARPEVRQAIAEALYRSLVRFTTTDDPGAGYVETSPAPGVSSGALPRGCTDPV